MPPPRARVIAFSILALWPAAQARAWTDATRIRMVRDALKVTPPALRTILLRYEKDLYRGMLDPSRHEDEEVHFQDADGRRGMGASAVVRKESEIRAGLKSRMPFRAFTYQMGILAHLVADVEFPLNASDADPREPLYREAYRAYIEKSLDKIPFVYDRAPSKTLEAGDLRGFIMEGARRAGENYALIGRAFNDDGTPRSKDALDERSVPFGIASLSYSHATSDIVRIWMRLWESLNGDLEGTPYLHAPPPEKATLPPRPKKNKPAPSASPSPTASPAPGASPSPGASPAPRREGP